MPRFSANLNYLFNEVPMLARFAAAKEAGFSAVEIQTPYHEPIDAITRAARAASVEVVLINTPLGDPAKSDRGLGALRGRESEFRDGVALAFDYAEALGAKCLHVLAGTEQSGGDLATFTKNLRWAAPEAAKRGLTLLVEPLNLQDNPGYVMNRLAQAETVIDKVGATNVRLQFDFYHAQVSEGDIANRFRRYQPLTAHVQFANVPGRHEPGRGEIDFAYLFDLIDSLGYTGWVGAEYRPSGTTRASLTWGQRYGIGNP